jgi:hypothetical protein
MAIWVFIRMINFGGNQYAGLVFDSNENIIPGNSDFRKFTQFAFVDKYISKKDSAAYAYANP